MVAISNVGNRYIAAIESSYGSTPSPFTALDWGHIQKITIGEEENLEKLSSLNSGHLAAKFEDGLYWANVSIETRVTKASIPVLLKAMMGTVSESTDYAASTSLTLNSYSLKVSYLSTTKCLLINGLAVKDWTISCAKGESMVFTLNCIAMKVAKSTEALSVSTNTDNIFSWLDCYATIAGNAHVLQNFTINGNWNITDDEGRGIETSTAGTRRTIRQVVKHRFDCSGNYEIELSDNGEMGYADDRSDEAIVFTASRGSDNEHVFTLSNTRSSKRDYEAGIDNTQRTVSYDFEALDLAVAGDL